MLAPVKVGRGYRFTFAYTVDDLETVTSFEQVSEQARVEIAEVSVSLITSSPASGSAAAIASSTSRRSTGDHSPRWRAAAQPRSTARYGRRTRPSPPGPLSGLPAARRISTGSPT